MKTCLLILLTSLLLASGALQAQEAGAEDLYLKIMQAVAEGRQDDANAILHQMMLSSPRNAGEWLDLAMVQCTLGHSSDAKLLFQQIEQQFAPEQGIIDLINNQRRQGCQSAKPIQQWSLSLARGSDTNVNQGASNPLYAIGDGTPLELLPEYQPHSDQYTTLTADLVRDLGQNGDQVFVQMHVRQHDTLSNYNTASMFVGIEHPWRLQRWRMRSSALAGILTLGGRLYQQQGQLQVRATPPLTLPAKLELNLVGSLAHTNYKTLSSFDATTAEVRTILSYRGEQTDAQFSTGYLYDKGTSDRPGGDRGGFGTRLYLQHPLIASVFGELDLSQQRWNGKAVYSPGLINEIRQQTTNSLRATLVYPYARDQAVHLEWRQVHNLENISLFQYSSHQIQLSWHWYGR